MNTNPRRLYRTADDRIIAGVAGGVAAYFDVDPVIVRIIWFLSVFMTGSLTFWAYIVMIWVVPLEPTEWPPQSPWAPGGGPAGFGANYTPPTASGFVPPAPQAPTPDAPASGPAADGTAPTQPGAIPDPAAGFASMPGQPPAPNAGWAPDWRTQRRQDRWARRSEREGFGGPGLAFGLLLILVGGLLAWHQVDPNFSFNLTWPIVVVAFGAMLVVSSIRRAGGN